MARATQAGHAVPASYQEMGGATPPRRQLDLQPLQLGCWCDVRTTRAGEHEANPGLCIPSKTRQIRVAVARASGTAVRGRESANLAAVPTPADRSLRRVPVETRGNRSSCRSWASAESVRSVNRGFDSSSPHSRMRPSRRARPYSRNTPAEEDRLRLDSLGR
jgi:hypothetical protein